MTGWSRSPPARSAHEPVRETDPIGLKTPVMLNTTAFGDRTCRGTQRTAGTSLQQTASFFTRKIEMPGEYLAFVKRMPQLVEADCHHDAMSPVAGPAGRSPRAVGTRRW